MLAEELIESLCKLGLTNNQARIYFIIASKTRIKVPEIANLTGIHEQDIYKVLPKLEQYGLITKTTTKPIIIEALAPEIALKELIKKQQESLDDAKKSTQEMIKLLQNKKSESSQLKSEEKVIIYNNNSQSYENISLLSRRGVRKTLDLLGDRDNTSQLLKYTLPFFEEDRKTLVKHHVKVRILSVYRDIEDHFSEGDLEQFSNLNIEIKKVRYSSDNSLPFLTYLINDGTELWVRVMGDPTCPFKVITTDCMPIVQIAKEHFEKSWQDNNAKFVFCSE